MASSDKKSKPNEAALPIRVVRPFMLASAPDAAVREGARDHATAGEYESMLGQLEAAMSEQHGSLVEFEVQYEAIRSEYQELFGGRLGGRLRGVSGGDDPPVNAPRGAPR